jgi:iron complex outermembrane receptor protein
VDLSNSLGSNRLHYGVKNTLNATLGTSSPTSFDAGGFQLQQDVVDLNVSRNVKTVAQGLNLAFGSEYGREWYQIFAGEAASYTNYAPTSGVASGAQGFSSTPIYSTPKPPKPAAPGTPCKSPSSKPGSSGG